MGNVTDPYTRELSSLICVLSIALIGTGLVLLQLSWKRFIKMSEEDSKIRARIVVNSAVTMLFIIILVNRVTTILGIHWPSGLLMKDSMLFEVVLYSWATLTAIWVIGYMSWSVIGIYKVIRRKPVDILARSRKTNYIFNLFCSLGACIFLVVCILSTIISLILDGGFALGLGVMSPIGFEQGRWILFNGISCFAFAIACLGISYSWTWYSGMKKEEN